MATESEGTLQINDFRGISRNKAIGKNPPAIFHTLQNWYTEKFGELNPVPGNFYDDLASDGFNNLTHVFNFQGDEILLSQHTYTDLPTPTIGDFAFARNGALSASYNYKISYCGLGVESPLSSLVLAEFGATGLTITPAITIPRVVSSINVYVEHGATGLYTWCGSAVRQSGSFAASFVINTAQATASGVAVPVDPVSVVTFTPGTGGTLTPGQTYYFGFAPWAAVTATMAYTTLSQAISGQTIAYTIPPGYSSVSVKANLTGLYDGISAYTHSILFMGITPEDLLAVSGGAENPRPVTLASITGGTGYAVLKLAEQQNNGVITDADVTGRKGLFYITRPSTTAFTTYYAMLRIAGPGSLYSYSLLKQVLPARGARLTDASGSSDELLHIKILSNYSSGKRVQTASLGERMWGVNGLQFPFYTNGIVLKEFPKDYQTAQPPVTEAIIAFENRLIMGGGESNAFNSKNLNYYTCLTSAGDANPFSFTTTPSATPVRNFFTTNPSSGRDVVGYGVFSYNESTTGRQSQLVIGCDSSIWMTPSVATAPIEGERNIGFSGPNAFANTDIGAFFVGREDLYYLSESGKAIGKGGEVSPILSKVSLPKTLLYHRGHLKIICDPSESFGSSILTTGNEIWCDLRIEKTATERGQSEGPRFTWTGPHLMHSANHQAVFPETVYQNTIRGEGITGGAPDNDSLIVVGVRRGVSALKRYWLDYEGSYTSEVSTSPTRYIVFNDLSLGADHFQKLFNGIYLSMKTTSDFTMGLTFYMLDQAQSPVGGIPTQYSETLTIDYRGTSAEDHKLYQFRFPTRYKGRVIKEAILAVTPTSANAILKISDISLLFKTLRRRLL